MLAPASIPLVVPLSSLRPAAHLLAVMLTIRLHQLLGEVRSAGGALFSGIGLLVSSAPDELPIMPLRSRIDGTEGLCTVKALTKVSQSSNEYHDGFHVLLPDLSIYKFSVYFSPPILRDSVSSSRRQAGGRYWAALFGSGLPTVLASGVASTRYGVAVFESGREVPFA